MVNEKIRKALSNMCEEMGLEDDERPIILDGMAYDNSIIGISADGSLVYDYDKMVDELVEGEGWDVTEAMEWLDYNTLRAIPYMEPYGKKPIILSGGIEAILEKYGE